MQVLGQAFGLQGVEDWAHDGVIRNLKEAALNPAQVKDYTEAEGQVGKYILEALGEELPQLGTDLLAFLGTGGAASITVGALGKNFLKNLTDEQKKKAVRKAAMAGAYTSFAGQSVGEVQLELMDQGIRAPGSAIGFGALNAFIEFKAAEYLIRPLFRRFQKLNMNEKLTPRTAAAAIGAAGLRGFTTESLTELVQTMNGKFAAQINGGKPVNSDEFITEYIDAAIKGGIVGGTLSGASSGLGLIGRGFGTYSDASTNAHKEADNLAGDEGDAAVDTGSTPPPTDGGSGGAAASVPEQQTTDFSDQLAQLGSTQRQTAQVVEVEDKAGSLLSRKVLPVEQVEPYLATTRLKLEEGHKMSIRPLSDYVTNEYQEPEPEQPEIDAVENIKLGKALEQEPVSEEEVADKAIEASSIMGRYLGINQAKNSREEAQEVAYRAKKDAYSAEQYDPERTAQMEQALSGSGLELPLGETVIDSRPRFMTSGGYDPRNNTIHLSDDKTEWSKDQSDPTAVTPERTMHHEVGHWGFMNLLTGEQRLKATEKIAGSLKHDLIPGEAGHDYPKHKFDNYDEYVAEMYSNYKRGLPTDERLLDEFEYIDSQLTQEDKTRIDGAIADVQQMLSSEETPQELTNEPEPDQRAVDRGNNLDAEEAAGVDVTGGISEGSAGSDGVPESRAGQAGEINSGRPDETELEAALRVELDKADLILPQFLDKVRQSFHRPEKGIDGEAALAEGVKQLEYLSEYAKPGSTLDMLSLLYFGLINKKGWHKKDAAAYTFNMLREVDEGSTSIRSNSNMLRNYSTKDYKAVFSRLLLEYAKCSHFGIKHNTCIDACPLHNLAGYPEQAGTHPA